MRAGCTVRAVVGLALLVLLLLLAQLASPPCSFDVCQPGPYLVANRDPKEMNIRHVRHLITDPNTRNLNHFEIVSSAECGSTSYSHIH
eukprot:2837885-Prymnesium_polylepis.1